MSEPMYDFLNRLLKSFSYQVTITEGDSSYLFYATCDGNSLAYIGDQAQIAKRVFAFSLALSDLPLVGGAPLQLESFSTFNVNFNGKIRRFKLCKDYEGIKFLNDRFNVPTDRVRFYGIEI